MNDDKRTIKFMGLVMGIMTIVTIMGLSFAYFTTQIEESDSYSLKGKAKSEGYDIGFIDFHSDEQRTNDQDIYRRDRRSSK